MTKYKVGDKVFFRAGYVYDAMPVIRGGEVLEVNDEMFSPYTRYKVRTLPPGVVHEIDIWDNVIYDHPERLKDDLTDMLKHIRRHYDKNIECIERNSNG